MESYPLPQFFRDSEPFDWSLSMDGNDTAVDDDHFQPDIKPTEVEPIALPWWSAF